MKVFQDKQTVLCSLLILEIPTELTITCLAFTIIEINSHNVILSELEDCCSDWVEWPLLCLAEEFLEAVQDWVAAGKVLDEALVGRKWVMGCGRFAEGLRYARCRMHRV
jgi:hypothetical protein